MQTRIKVYLDNGAAPIAELADATQRFEIDTTKLQIDDACYPVVVAVRAQKVGDA